MNLTDYDVDTSKAETRIVLGLDLELTVTRDKGLHVDLFDADGTRLTTLAVFRNPPTDAGGRGYLDGATLALMAETARTFYPEHVHRNPNV